MKLTLRPKFQNRKPLPLKFLGTTFLALFFLFIQNDFQSFLFSSPGQITTITGGGRGADLQQGILNNRAAEQLVSLFQQTASSVQVTISRSRPAPALQVQVSKAPAFYQGASPELITFIGQVANGETGRVRGVYIEGVLALPVIQQPTDEVAFVSTEMDTITEFNSAASNGITGLLAHNYLSGALFYNITIGQEVVIVYGDGLVRRYQVEGIQEFQRLEPNNLRSRFVDLSNNYLHSSDQIFNRFYSGEHKVTLQTCLAKDGLSNWGLTFTVATPLDSAPVIPVP